jgi:acyl-coenzyme A thioesterase PaaI-like protein
MAMLADTEKRTDLPGHRTCFACGREHPGGLHLCFSIGADGGVRGEWFPDDALRSYDDRLHGGILATVLDSAMVHSLAAVGVAGVTAELTLRYLRAIVPGQSVEIAARVDRVRHGIHFCSAELRQHETIAVRATAKFLRKET